MDSVTLTTHPRFVLLEPRSVPPRVGESYQQICPTGPQLETLLRSAFQSQLIAVDFETKGNDYSLPASDAHVIGVGLAWDRGSCYLDPSSLSATEWRLLDRIFLEHKGLLAHNVYFDGGWLRRDYGVHAGWYACTYGMYMQLASEGFEGQKWSLKDAMTDLLMWSSTNETDLDNWLVSNGYKNQSHRPLKGEMWRAPPDILGKYCVLDAEATYLLFTEIFQPVLDKFPSVLQYHRDDFLPHVLTHIDQKMYGILTDRDHWLRYTSELVGAIAASEHAFRNHERVAPLIAEWEAKKMAIFLEKEPPQFKKGKERTEPEKYTKKGELSKNWLKWYELSQRPPEINNNWLKWREKKSQIDRGELSDYKFNLQSGDHLRWLLYDQLKFPTKLETDSGLPAVSEDALQSMGDIGQILIGRALKVKELSYVEDYVERTETRPTLHPSFRMPGTVTGRLAGKEPNLQQLPKTKGTLTGLISRPGHSFVDCDVNALEMVVTAELSQDRNLLSLYGPDATWPTLSTQDLITMLELQGIRYRVLANGDIEVCDEDL